jgi:hypothetical protein
MRVGMFLTVVAGGVLWGQLPTTPISAGPPISGGPPANGGGPLPVVQSFHDSPIIISDSSILIDLSNKNLLNLTQAAPDFLSHTHAHWVQTGTTCAMPATGELSIYPMHSLAVSNGAVPLSKTPSVVPLEDCDEIRIFVESLQGNQWSAVDASQAQITISMVYKDAAKTFVNHATVMEKTLVDPATKLARLNPATNMPLLDHSGNQAWQIHSTISFTENPPILPNPPTLPSKPSQKFHTNPTAKFRLSRVAVYRGTLQVVMFPLSNGCSAIQITTGPTLDANFPLIPCLSSVGTTSVTNNPTQIK